MDLVAPIAVALFAWWLGTGVILLAVTRHPRTHGVSLWTAAALALVALGAVAATRNGDTPFDAYVGFAAALMVWGFVETTFLTGVLTGPRRKLCPVGARGWRRARYATQTIIHHELALVAAGAAIAIATWDGLWDGLWGGGNLTALFTFGVLWVMRLSSKFNLFLGVRTTNAEMLTPALAHLQSYFRTARMNPLFPFSVALAAAGMVALAIRAAADTASAFDQTQALLLAALLGLALLEHVFMMLPLPLSRLWGVPPMAAKPTLVQPGTGGIER